MPELVLALLLEPMLEPMRKPMRKPMLELDWRRRVGARASGVFITHG